MIESKIIFGIFASLVGICCFLPYLRDIFKKKTTPHAYSWLVWTILQTIGAIAIVKSGGAFGALSLAIGAAFCACIFFLSFKYGTKNITRFDTICLIGAFITLGILFIFKNAYLALLLVALIDLLGFLPTLRKAYVEPGSETPSTYLLSGLSSTLALVAVAVYALPTVIYLASLIVTNILCGMVILVRRK